jgi:two-component system cell cycle response regulator
VDDATLDPALEQERDRVVVELAGAVAHNLKQPLAVAWGYLELLLDDPAMTTYLSSAYLREIQESLRSMDEIINQLHQLTRHETRGYAGGLEILDLKSMH